MMDEQRLVLSAVDRKNFLETAKWGKFLAILGFIFSGFIVLGGLAFMRGSMGDVYPGFGSGVGALYIIMSLLYIFPSLFLYKFSSKIKSGIVSGNSDECSIAYNNLRKLFLFTGVFTIIILGIYILAILFMLMGGMMGEMF